MTHYQTHIASIGNRKARQNELERCAEILDDAQAVPMLIDALEDPHPMIRHSAAELLAARMNSSVFSQLAQAFKLTASEELHRAIALAMRTPDLPEEGRTWLRTHLPFPDAPTRYHLWLALHEIVDEETPDLPELLDRGLMDSDPGVQVVAAQIAAHRRVTDVRHRVRDAMFALEGTDRFQLCLSMIELSIQANEPFSPAEENLISSSIIDAFDREETTMAAIAGAIDLARHAPKVREDMVGKLKGQLSTFMRHPLIRVEAAAGLAALGDQQGVEYLQKQLKSRRIDTRGYAIEKIGTLRINQLLPHIEAIARDPADKHYDHAREALAEFSDAW